MSIMANAASVVSKHVTHWVAEAPPLPLSNVFLFWLWSLQRFASTAQQSISSSSSSCWHGHITAGCPPIGQRQAVRPHCSSVFLCTSAHHFPTLEILSATTKPCEICLNLCRLIPTQRSLCFTSYKTKAHTVPRQWAKAHTESFLRSADVLHFGARHGELLSHSFVQVKHLSWKW